MAGKSSRLLAAIASTKSQDTALGAKAMMLTALRSRREALGLSQSDMAEKLGCSREAFCLIENDDRNPRDKDFLFRWSAALGGSIGVTFNGTK